MHLDAVVDPGVEEEPAGDVEDDDEIDVEEVGESEVDDAEEGRDGDDGHHGRARGHPCGEEFVVDVVLVGEEG